MSVLGDTRQYQKLSSGQLTSCRDIGRWARVSRPGTTRPYGQAGRNVRAPCAPVAGIFLAPIGSFKILLTSLLKAMCRNCTLKTCFHAVHTPNAMILQPDILAEPRVHTPVESSRFVVELDPWLDPWNAASGRYTKRNVVVGP